jgi:hypothetical protein
MKVAGFVIIMVILAAGFTLDDLTGIGEILDPVEFALMMLVGAGYPAMTGMYNPRSSAKFGSTK